MWKKTKTGEAYTLFESMILDDETGDKLERDLETKYLDARMAFAMAVLAMNKIWKAFEDMHDPDRSYNNFAQWKELEWDKFRTSSSWKSLNRVLEARQGDFFTAYRAWRRSKTETKAKTEKATSTAK